MAALHTQPMKTIYGGLVPSMVYFDKLSQREYGKEKKQQRDEERRELSATRNKERGTDVEKISCLLDPRIGGLTNTERDDEEEKHNCLGAENHRDITCDDDPSLDPYGRAIGARGQRKIGYKDLRDYYYYYCKKKETDDYPPGCIFPSSEYDEKLAARNYGNKEERDKERRELWDQRKAARALVAKTTAA